MKFFSRRPGGTAEIDPAWGDSQARHLREQLARGKWQEAHVTLEPMRDWDDRQFYVEVLTDAMPGRPKWTEEWVKAYPQSSLAWLMRGAQGVRWAWEARGGGKAESVEDASWKVFWERLQEAQRDLHHAAELDPHDPVPWTHLLIIGRGLETGIPDIGERLKQVQARKPWHHFALSQALQGYARKWGGSHELMFDLARQVAEGAPEGSSAHTLLAEAHVERWLYMSSWDNEADAALGYFRTAPVIDEVKQAAARSIFSPSYERPRLAPFDYNIFTYCFFRMHDWEQARRAMQAMNGTLNRFPWAYAGDPVKTFAIASERIRKGA